jgi:plastocyanin
MMARHRRRAITLQRDRGIMNRDAKLLLPMLALIGSACFSQAREVKIGVRSGELKYDTTRIVVKPGETVEVVFSNKDQMPHNVVFCKKGTDIKKVADAAVALGADGLKLNYLPKMNEILGATPLVNQGKSFTLKFKAPKQAGEYPYVCTFPGHYVMMNGIMQVGGKPPTATPLTSLSYKYYEGSWKKLPDFSKLEAEKQGVLPKNLVNINQKGFKKDGYGLVFNAKLTVEKAGQYTITAGSDDGGRILINGKKAWEYDGIHPAKNKDAKIKLEKGVHDVEIQYFEGSGNNAFNISWKGPGMKNSQAWSEGGGAKGGGKRGGGGAPIVIKPTDKPALYRDFYNKAGSRGIGVGYPEGVNAMFDANYCRWLQLWRGEFIDAGVHWHGRGKGTTQPLGETVIDLAHADPIAVLKSADEKWPARAEHKGDVPGEKSGVHFGGYLLDAKGRPTMLYALGGAEVTDTLEPIDIDGVMCVKRTVKITGKLDGLYLLAGRARAIEGSGQGPYKIGDELAVKFRLKGFAEPTIRANDDGFDLVLAVQPSAKSAALEQIFKW